MSRENVSTLLDDLNRLYVQVAELTAERDESRVRAENVYRAKEILVSKLAAAEEEARVAREALAGVARDSMTAQSDPNREASAYRGALIAICNKSLAALDVLIPAELLAGAALRKGDKL